MKQNKNKVKQKYKEHINCRGDARQKKYNK